MLLFKRRKKHHYSAFFKVITILKFVKDLFEIIIYLWEFLSK